MNGHWDSEAKGAWTAVSRVPHLKAVALWAKGDCWNGGGLFTGPVRYWLNGASCHTLVRETGEVALDRAFQPAPGLGNNECLGVHVPRLVRDGWTLVDKRRAGDEAATVVFDRPMGYGWVLRKLARSTLNPPQGRGVHYDQHVLLHASTGSPDAPGCVRCRRPTGWG